MNIISATAPAKINLYLHVTGKNQADYHLLDSLVAFANIHDRIEVAIAPKITVNIIGDYAHLISTEDNSVLKTAHVLRNHFKIKSGAAITLQKNLPVGAGIGSGSADAAAAIKLLLRLWQISASQEDLAAITLALGADVPACLQSVSLYMSGIGEVIELAPRLPKLHMLLVGTGKPLLTKDVFRHYKGRFSKPAARPKEFPSRIELIAFLNNTKNDLQDSAIRLMPEIADILAVLNAENDCLLARMSGSGSTCFGLFAKRIHAENIAMQLGKTHPEWWARAASIV